MLKICVSLFGRMEKRQTYSIEFECPKAIRAFFPTTVAIFFSQQNRMQMVSSIISIASATEVR